MEHGRPHGITRGWRIAALASLIAISTSTRGEESPEPAAVTMSTDRTHYAYGDSARVVVANDSETLLLYSIACGLVVDGRRGETWRAVQEPDCSRIRVLPTRLAPGGRDTTWVPMAPCAPEELAEFDAFRLRLRVQSDAGDSWLVHAGPLEVTPPDAPARPDRDAGD